MAATLQTSIIQASGSTTPNLTLDTAGNATVGGMVVPASSFKRNRIINGDMRVWQRGTSTTTTTSAYLTADRWASWIQAGSGTISQETSVVPSGFQYGLKFTSSGASSNGNFYQTIETLNCVDMAGQNAIASIYLAGTAGRTVSINFGYSTTTDAAFTSGFTSIASSTVTLTTTPTRYFITGAIPSNAKTLQMWIIGGAMNSTEYYTITGVQLEVGSVATPYERQIYSDQLAQCQRYYWQINSDGTYAGIASGQMNGATIARFTLRYPQPMRAAPTVSFTNIGNLIVNQGGADLTPSALTSYTNTTNLLFDLTTGTGVIGRGSTVIFNQSASSSMQASAEL